MLRSLQKRTVVNRAPSARDRSVCWRCYPVLTPDVSVGAKRLRTHIKNKHFFQFNVLMLIFVKFGKAPLPTPFSGHCHDPCLFRGLFPWMANLVSGATRISFGGGGGGRALGEGPQVLRAPRFSPKCRKYRPQIVTTCPWRPISFCTSLSYSDRPMRTQGASSPARHYRDTV